MPTYTLNNNSDSEYSGDESSGGYESSVAEEEVGMQGQEGVGGGEMQQAIAEQVQEGVVGGGGQRGGVRRCRDDGGGVPGGR